MRLLDLCCGEGGAALGYNREGFDDIVGVDSSKACGRHYPFSFVHADAIEYVKQHGHEYDAIHASPPCQRYTHGNVAGTQADRHPDLIGVMRDALVATGKPYVIENVPRSPLIDPLVLCGTMFDLCARDDDGTLLRLRRHRLFESSMTLVAPRACSHPSDAQWAGSYGGARSDKREAREVRRGGYVPRRALQYELMGVKWHGTLHGLQESVPPSYTAWIARQIMGATA